MLKFLKPGKYYLDYGPMQMTLAAFKEDNPLDSAVKEAADYARDLLQELSWYQNIARLPVGDIKTTETLPAILKNMIEAVKSCDDPSLTPMAAVAGSIADAVADYLVRRGATKVIVNNGGDIAIRIGEDSTVRVGITSRIDAPAYDYVINVNGKSPIRGIATSGLGGRSFTKGIASAAVALGTNCRVADACATVIGNATIHPHPGIKQVAAEKLDPNTDIPEELVTVMVDGVDDATFKKALEKGMEKAGEFYGKKIIEGAVVFVDRFMAVEPVGLRSLLVPAGSK